jgi:hypothetical protein
MVLAKQCNSTQSSLHRISRSIISWICISAIMNKSLSNQLVDSQLQLKTVLEGIFLNIYIHDSYFYRIFSCIMLFSFGIMSSFQLSY